MKQINIVAAVRKMVWNEDSKKGVGKLVMDHVPWNIRDQIAGQVWNHTKELISEQVWDQGYDATKQYFKENCYENR